MSENGKNTNGGARDDGPDSTGHNAENTGEGTAQRGDFGGGETPRAEVEKYKNDYMYLRAEFENFKKQVIKERSDMRKYGSERLIIDLLNVLDIFETALATELSPESLSNFRKGIEMTATELRNTLHRHGVSEVPSKGQPFDPGVHEALSSEETDEHPSGFVTQVYKKPYKLHDRVVRPGQVVVSKPKS